MKVAFVTAYQSFTGGMEIFSRRLQKALEEQGHTIEWFSLENVDHTFEMKMSRLASFFPQREKWKARALAKVFAPRSNEFDVVIANDYFGMYLNHPRVVMVTHGYYPDIASSIPEGISSLRRVWWNQLGKIQKEAMSRAWKSVTVSNRNARILEEDHCKVDVAIPHGIDTDFFHPIRKAKETLDIALPEEPFLLFVGSNAPWKNAQMVQRLSNTYPIAWLGKDPGMGGSIHPLPPLKDNQMPALYSASPLLAHPVFHEGFGYAPIEGMACGTPTLFTRTGVGEDIAKEIPEMILQNPQSLEEAHEKIRYLLDNRAEFGKKSRRYVEKYHAWKDWSRAWNKLVKEGN